MRGLAISLLLALFGCGGDGANLSHRVPTKGGYRFQYTAASSQGEPTPFGSGEGTLGFEREVTIEEFATDSVDGSVQVWKRVISEDQMFIFEVSARDPGPYNAIGYLARQSDGSYTGNFTDLFLPINYTIKLTPISE